MEENKNMSMAIYFDEEEKYLLALLEFLVLLNQQKKTCNISKQCALSCALFPLEKMPKSCTLFPFLFLKDTAN